MMDAIALSVFALAAQSLAFDAASVREVKGQAARATFTESPGGLAVRNATPLEMLLWAFQTQERDVTGVPDWARATRFDIIARTDRQDISRQDLRQMMRTLLVQRFGLEADTEIAERPVYALTLARRDGRLGPDLRDSTSTCTPPTGSTPVPTAPPAPVKVLTFSNCGVAVASSSGSLTAVIGSRATMRQLAEALSRGTFLDRRVIDRTALDGEFDFMINPSASVLAKTSADGLPPPPGFEFLTALELQAGLKLESTRADVEILAIRRLQRPTDN